MNLSEIVKTSWLIKTDIVQQNIQRMKHKADDHGLILRPHFKTHQSVEPGNFFKKSGIRKITVSSMDMAMEFIRAGFRDICLAIPFNIRETERLNSIPEEIRFHICIESMEVLSYLGKHAKRQTGIYIKTDCGYHRSGIDFEETETFRQLIKSIKSFPQLSFTGLLTHSGHTYHANSKAEIKLIHKTSLKSLQKLKSALGDTMFISIGDTPSMSICNDFTGADEIRPGNFVYYDLMQYYLGACNTGDIAGRLLTPVIARNTDRHEIIIHAGAVHLSKEFLINDGQKNFGEVTAVHKKDETVHLQDRPRIIKLSQEHGTVHLSPEHMKLIDYGDLLEILPIHSCLTANLMKQNTIYR